MTTVAVAPPPAETHLYSKECGCGLCQAVEIACSIVAIGEAGKAAIQLMDECKPGRLRTLYGEAVVALSDAGEAMRRYVDTVEAIRELQRSQG